MVYGAGLENRYGSNLIVGSNPTPSATLIAPVSIFPLGRPLNYLLLGPVPCMGGIASIAGPHSLIPAFAGMTELCKGLLGGKGPISPGTSR